MSRLWARSYPALAAAASLAVAAILSSCHVTHSLAHAGSCIGGADHRASHGSHGAAGVSRRAQIGDEVTCPVDGMKIRVTPETPWTEYRGRTYYFCSESDQRAFLRQPERYAGR